MKSVALWSCLICLLIACNTKNDASIDDKSLEDSSSSDFSKYYAVDPQSSVFTWILSTSKGKLDGYLTISDGQLNYDSTSSSISGIMSIDLSDISAQNSTPSTEQSITSAVESMKEWLTAPSDSLSTLSIRIKKVGTIDGWTPTEIQEQPSDFTPEIYTNFMLPNATHLIETDVSLLGITKEISFPARVVFEENRLLISSRFNMDLSNWIDLAALNKQLEEQNLEAFIHKTLNAGLVVYATYDRE